MLFSKYNQKAFLEKRGARTYLRHDSREMKHFRSEIGQITVQEDKERLNYADVLGKSRGKGGRHPEGKAY